MQGAIKAFKLALDEQASERACPRTITLFALNNVETDSTCTLDEEGRITLASAFERRLQQHFFFFPEIKSLSFEEIGEKPFFIKSLFFLFWV